MDWLKQNPFFAGLLAAVSIVMIGGSYLVVSAAGQFDEEQMTFDQKSAQLQSLQGNKPFPDNANVEAANREVEEARAALDELAKGLSVSVPEVTPQDFMDQLSKLAKDLSDKANARSIELPDKFFLGFERYETQLPAADIAPKLASQLRAIHTVVSVLLEAQVKSVGPVSRAAVEGEQASPSQPAAGEKQREEGGIAPSLEIAPFDISFVADQPSFRLAFNRIADADPPVFIRLVGIENSSPAAPLKSAASAPESAAPSEAAAPQPSEIKPVVGRETLSVNLRLATVLPPAGGSDHTKP